MSRYKVRQFKDDVYNHYDKIKNPSIESYFRNNRTAEHKLNSFLDRNNIQDFEVVGYYVSKVTVDSINKEHNVTYILIKYLEQ